jgi:hypothetical protein
MNIRGQEGFDMINALSAEVETFKKALKPEYTSINIPSIPRFAF